MAGSLALGKKKRAWIVSNWVIFWVIFEKRNTGETVDHSLRTYYTLKLFPWKGIVLRLFYLTMNK